MACAQVNLQLKHLVIGRLIMIYFINMYVNLFIEVQVQRAENKLNEVHKYFIFLTERNKIHLTK